MHPIRKYLKRTELSQAEFARRIGVSRQTLNDVLQSRSYLGRRAALDAVRASGGAITLEDLLTWEKPKPKRRRRVA